MKWRASSRFLEGFLCALTAFGPFAFGCVEPWSRAALEILTFLLALACFLRGRPAVSRTAALFWLFPAGFAALGLLQLRALAAPDAPRPWTAFTAAPHATGAAVLLWAAYAALLWSVPRIIVTHEAARRYARFLFGLGLALAALGVLQAATGADKLYWLRAAPAGGFFGPYYDRDDAANVLVMSLAVGAGLFFSSLARRVPGGEGSQGRLRPRGLLAGGVLFLFASVLVSGSRGALLAIPLAGAVVALSGAGFARRASGRRAVAAAALAAAAAAVFLTFRYVADGADAGALVDKSVMGRLSIYGDAWRWWRDAPLFGTGLGSFETVYPSYQDFELRGLVLHAHSDWLEVLLETGALGALAALVGGAVAAWAAVRAWRSARSAEMRALIGGGLAAAAAFSAHALFEFCFQIPANAFVFLAIVGFLLSAPAWADKADAAARPTPPSAGPSLLATACFLLLARAAVRPAAAEWRANAPGDSGERAAGLARAFSVDPDPYFPKKLAALLYQTAGERDTVDPRALRLALSYSLEALEPRPFDYDVRYLAGAILSRLGRPADARVLIDETRLLRFAPVRVAPDETADSEGARGKLEVFRAAGILPQAPEKR